MISYTVKKYEPKSAESFEPIPDGFYKVTMDKIETKVSKGDRYHAFWIKITDGKQKDRLIFQHFFFEGKSDQCHKISCEVLDGLCYAVNSNIPEIQDITQSNNLLFLTRKPFVVRYARNKKGEGGIKRFFRTDEVPFEKLGADPVQKVIALEKPKVAAVDDSFVDDDLPF